VFAVAPNRASNVRAAIGVVRPLVRLLEQVRKTQDRRHRSTNFVAHVGRKLALRAACVLRGNARFPQLDFALEFGGHIHRGTEQLDHFTCGSAPRTSLAAHVANSAMGNSRAQGHRVRFALLRRTSHRPVEHLCIVGVVDVEHTLIVRRPKARIAAEQREDLLRPKNFTAREIVLPTPKAPHFLRLLKSRVGCFEDACVVGALGRTVLCLRDIARHGKNRAALWVRPRVPRKPPVFAVAALKPVFEPVNQFAARQRLRGTKGRFAVVHVHERHPRTTARRWCSRPRLRSVAAKAPTQRAGACDSPSSTTARRANRATRRACLVAPRARDAPCVQSRPPLSPEAASS